jgi:hypothetical protein
MTDLFKTEMAMRANKLRTDIRKLQAELKQLEMIEARELRDAIAEARQLGRASRDVSTTITDPV